MSSWIYFVQILFLYHFPPNLPVSYFWYLVLFILILFSACQFIVYRIVYLHAFIAVLSVLENHAGKNWWKSHVYMTWCYRWKRTHQINRCLITHIPSILSIFFSIFFLSFTLKKTKTFGISLLIFRSYIHYTVIIVRYFPNVQKEHTFH